MNLFKQEPINILPFDGEAIYFGKLFSEFESNTFYKKLFSGLSWKSDEAIILGKHIITKRKVAWYGDEAYEYTYSKITKQAMPWTNELLELKKIAERIIGVQFNSCLANLYHAGDEGMAWHSDAEKTLAYCHPIASWSFGAERKFSFKHKQSGETRSVILEHGSLLSMQGTCQIHWLHRLPITKKTLHPRVNLTFRKIVIP